MQQNPRYVPVFETDSGRGLPPALISHWCWLQCSTNWCSLHLSWRQTVILNSNLCKVQIFWQDSAGRAIKPHFDFLQNSALNQPTLWMTIDFSDDNCPWQEAFTMRQLLGFLGWRPQWVSCFSLPDCLHTCKIRVMAIVCDDLLWPASFASSGENCWRGWLSSAGYSVCSPNTWKIGALIWVEQHCQVSQTIGIRPYICFACSEVLGWGPKKARGRFYWAGHICSFSLHTAVKSFMGRPHARW